MVVNCVADGCTAAGFDVHEEAYNIEFSNCHSRGNFAGAAQSSGYGFQARAKNIRFNSCTVSDSIGGFYIFEQYAGTTDRIILDNCKTFNVQQSIRAIVSQSGVRVRNVQITGGRFESLGSVGNTYNGADVTIVGATFVTAGYQGHLLQANANVQMKDCTLQSTATASASRIVDVTSSRLTLQNTVLDVSQTNISTNDPKLVLINDSASSVVADKVSVITGGKAIFNVFAGFTSSKGNLTVKDLNVDQDVTVLPEGNFSPLSFSYTTPTKSSAVRTQTLSADNSAPNIANINDPVVYLSVSASGGNYMFGVFPLGVRLGQMLIIKNTGATYTVTIQDGASYHTSLGGNIVLNPGQTARLVWDGQNWVSIT